MKVEIHLVDLTWLEGNIDESQSSRAGIWLKDAFRSKQEGTVPLGESVFVPYSAMLLIVEKSANG